MTAFYKIEADNVNNTGTLFDNILSKSYPPNLVNRVLLNTLLIRNQLLNLAKKIIEKHETIQIKEFYDVPPMIYDDAEKFHACINELSTDSLIVKSCFNMKTLRDADNKVSKKYSLVIEALDFENITSEKWNAFLDEIHTIFYDENAPSQRVSTITIENIIPSLKKISDSTQPKYKAMVEAYLKSISVIVDPKFYWIQPLTQTTIRYWEKFSFSIVLNDRDIYEESNKIYLDTIIHRLFNNGFVDELVIVMNHVMWFDNYQKILDFLKMIDYCKISFRFQTIIPNNDKYRYANEYQAKLHKDYQRKNTIEEEMLMYEQKIPIFMEKIISDERINGIELEGGYFGKEGFIPNLKYDSKEFNDFKKVFSKILKTSPFTKPNDTIEISFNKPKKIKYVSI